MSRRLIVSLIVSNFASCPVDPIGAASCAQLCLHFEWTERERERNGGGAGQLRQKPAREDLRHQVHSRRHASECAGNECTMVKMSLESGEKILGHSLALR